MHVDGWEGIKANDCRGGEGGDEKLVVFIVAVAAVVSVALLSGYDSNPELKFVLDVCRWCCGNSDDDDDDDDDSSAISKSYCSE